MTRMNSEGMHSITLTDREVRYLRGHLAFEGGIGRDIYDRVKALPVEVQTPRLPTEEAK